MRNDRINKRNQIDREFWRKSRKWDFVHIWHLQTAMAAPFFTSASSKIGAHMFLFFKEAFALGDCQALLEAAFIQMSWMELKQFQISNNLLFHKLDSFAMSSLNLFDEMPEPKSLYLFDKTLTFFLPFIFKMWCDDILFS